MSDGRWRGKNFSRVLSDFWLRFGAAGVLTDRQGPLRGNSYRLCERESLFPFRFRGRIAAKAGEGELLRFGATANPEQAVEVNADGSGGLGMEVVGHVDPGADAGGLCQTRDERESQRGAAGAFRTGKFGDGADGQAAAEYVVESRNASGRGGVNDVRRWGERGGDTVGKGGFDLEAEQVGGGHGSHIFALYSPIG